MRLIDADALIKDLCTILALTPIESWTVEKCIEKANNAPTIDNNTEITRKIFAEFQNILFSLVYLGGDGNFHLKRMKSNETTLVMENYFSLIDKYTKEGVDK